MKNIYLLLLIFILSVSHISCSKDESADIEISLEYTDLYVTDQEIIEFEIISGSGEYVVQSSNEDDAVTSVTGNVVIVRFKSYAEVEITITDAKQKSLVIPMKSLSEQINAPITLLSIRINTPKLVDLPGSAAGYSLLKPDNEYVVTYIDKESSKISFKGIKEGETEIRLIGEDGSPYAYRIRVGDPDPDKVNSIIQYEWETGHLECTLKTHQLTHIHILWAEGYIEPYSLDESHHYCRTIQASVPVEHTVLEIVTSSCPWATWMRRIELTDNSGNTRTLILRLE